MKRCEALAIADYRSPRKATRSRNGNRRLRQGHSEFVRLQVRSNKIP